MSKRRLEEDRSPGIENLLDNALCIRKTDRILVAGDPEKEENPFLFGHIGHAD